MLEWKTNEALAVGKGATYSNMSLALATISWKWKSPPGVKVSLRSMAGKSHASTMPRIAVRLFVQSNRLRNVTWRLT